MIKPRTSDQPTISLTQTQGSIAISPAGARPRRLVTLLAQVITTLFLLGPACWAQVAKEFSDDFPRIEIKGGSKCVEMTKTVCLPKNCRIDFDRTLSTPTSFSGGYGQAGPGYGVVISSMNNHRPAGFATYTLDTQTQCLKTTIKVCAKNQQRGWYEGHHVIYAKCYPRCDCGPGAWFDLNRDSCVTAACGEPVTGMPDGDKGGGYFAWQNALFKDVPCSSTPCQALNQSLNTGTAAWQVTPPGSVQAPATPVTNVPPNWATSGTGQWISHNAGSGSEGSGVAWAGGNYIYQTTFCLCANYQQAALQLLVWGDNNIQSVRLNGNLIGGPTTNGTAFQGLGLNISENIYNHFVPGQNVLQIVVNNFANSATGFRVSGTITAVAGKCP